MDSRPTFSPFARAARKLAIFGLFAFAVAIPHSIALGQISAGLMLAGWLGSGGWRRGSFRWRTPWTWPVVLFILWSLVSSFLSYEPAVSTDKLRGVGLAALFFLVFNLVRDRRLGQTIILTLACSMLVNVAYVYAIKVRGRGMEILALAPASPLRSAGLEVGDVILTADGKEISTAEDLTKTTRLAIHGPVELFVFRPEVYFYRPLVRPPDGWPDGPGWGVESRRWRKFRAAGFYGWNYFTYAEVAQLVGSLMIALMLTSTGWMRWAWCLASVATTGAIALTLTRAVWAAFTCSAAIMIWRSGRRKLLLWAAALALVAAPLALREMQRARGISPVQLGEPSASYRRSVWRDGWQLLWSSPRHVIVGVGMDSIKRRWREWDLFEGGRLPVGHMHSTPLQLAVERGVPGVALWIWWFASYARFLWKQTALPAQRDEARNRALYLGSLGSTVGFLVSSLVHYNFGDSEVVMVVYLLMGLVAAESLAGERRGGGVEG